MRTLFFLFLASSCLAVSNYNVRVAKDAQWSATAFEPVVSTITDASVVWVAKHSSAATQDGTMGLPFKEIDETTITASYNRVMIVSPGTYTVPQINVLGNMTIMSLSDNPGDTKFTYSGAGPMFMATNGLLYLRGVTVTSTNEVAAGTAFEGGAIHADASMVEVVNCTFDACVLSDTGIINFAFSGSVADGGVYRNCNFYNCVNKSGYGYGSIRNAELYNCLMTNCYADPATSVTNAGMGGALWDSDVYWSRLLDCDSAFNAVSLGKYTWFDVEVKDCKAPGSLNPTFAQTPSVMFNVRASGCQNGYAVLKRFNYEAHTNAVMFNCSFINNNNPYTLVVGYTSAPSTDTNGVSGIQMSDFSETNGSWALSQDVKGNVLGCSTNGVFYENLYINTLD